MVRAFASALVLASCVAMFAKMSHSELIEHRKQSVKDWKTVINMLQKAGYSDKDSVYKRTNAALRRSETRLGHLEKGTFTGTDLREKGRGWLERAGILSPKKTETSPRKTLPKQEKATSKKRKAPEKEAKRRVAKKPKKANPLK